MNLRDELRVRISDTRTLNPAITVGCTATASVALLEITREKFLITTVSGSDILPLRIRLDLSEYATLGALYQHLSRVSGYVAYLCSDVNEKHLSVDLESIPPSDIRKQGITICTHVFDDTELDAILESAVKRHNPGFSLSSLPDTEYELVLLLARAEVERRRAQDGTKRKGTTADVSALLQSASALESIYEQDIKRLARSIQPAKQVPIDDIRQGQVIVGSLWRMSPRNNYAAPIGSALQLTPPQLFDPLDEDIEDTCAQIRWKRITSEHFQSAELWCDVHMDVRRDPELPNFTRLIAPQYVGTSKGTNRPTTSKLVAHLVGGSSRSVYQSFISYTDSTNQLVTAVLVTNLEPSTEYFFRMYLIDTNHAAVASELIKLTTKPLRTKFDPSSALSVNVGLPGTVVTVNFDANYGPFTNSNVLTIGGKTVAATIVSPYQVQFTVPTFVNRTDAKDIVVQSPTGLRDILLGAFSVST